MNTMVFTKFWRHIVFALLVLAVAAIILRNSFQKVGGNTFSRSSSFSRMQKKEDVELVHTSPLTKAPTTKVPEIIDIYQPVVAKPAGGGSSSEESQRIRLYLATQGAICEDIRRVGGAKLEKGSPPQMYSPDGAWDVCFGPGVGLDPKSCIVYSIGIDNDFSFDDGLALYGCQVFSFDPTMGQKDYKHAAKVTFFNTGLGGHDQEGNGQVVKNAPKSNWRIRTLKSIIKELHHEKDFIDVLKMDIESDEWSSLPQMLKDGTLRRYVRQLIVEFHVTNQSPDGLRGYYSILKWLDLQGFKVTSSHQNPYCLPCHEMTFLNTAVRGKSKLGDENKPNST